MSDSEKTFTPARFIGCYGLGLEDDEAAPAVAAPAAWCDGCISGEKLLLHLFN